MIRRTGLALFTAAAFALAGAMAGTTTGAHAYTVDLSAKKGGSGGGGGHGGSVRKVSTSKTVKGSGANKVVKTQKTVVNKSAGVHGGGFKNVHGNGHINWHGHNYSVWRGPYRYRWGNRWVNFVALGTLAAITVGAVSYYPYAYLSAPQPACVGTNEEGCQLRWQEVATQEGVMVPQCVAFCPWQ